MLLVSMEALHRMTLIHSRLLGCLSSCLYVPITQVTNGQATGRCLYLDADIGIMAQCDLKANICMALTIILHKWRQLSHCSLQKQKGGLGTQKSVHRPEEGIDDYIPSVLVPRLVGYVCSSPGFLAYAGH